MVRNDILFLQIKAKHEGVVFRSQLWEGRRTTVVEVYNFYNYVVVEKVFFWGGGNFDSQSRLGAMAPWHRLDTPLIVYRR